MPWSSKRRMNRFLAPSMVAFHSKMIVFMVRSWISGECPRMGSCLEMVSQCWFYLFHRWWGDAGTRADPPKMPFILSGVVLTAVDNNHLAGVSLNHTHEDWNYSSGLRSWWAATPSTLLSYERISRAPWWSRGCESLCLSLPGIRCRKATIMNPIIHKNCVILTMW